MTRVIAVREIEALVEEMDSAGPSALGMKARRFSRILDSIA